MNGGHHPREATSIHMTLYTLIETLFSIVNENDTDLMNTMRDTSIFFIPIVNVDGYKYISDVYKKEKRIAAIRKNR